MTTSAEAVLPGRSKALLATAALAVMLTAADTYVVVLALEDMMSGVGLGLADLGRATPIVSGFLLGYIAVLPIIGRLSDLVSRQRVLLWCLVLFALGSVITAMAVELPTMVAGRVLQGVGGGGLLPATLALVADLLPRGRRGTALGMVSAIQEIGSVLGPLLGAAILALWSWRAIFWINAIGAVVLAALMMALSRGSATGQAEISHAEHGEEKASSAGAHVLPQHARQDKPRGVTLWISRFGWVAGVLGFAVIVLALWAPDRLTSDITYGPPFVPYEGHTARLATPIGLWGLGLLAAGIVLTFPVWLPRLRSIDVVGSVLTTSALGCLIWTFASADPATQVVGTAGLWLLPLAALCLVAYLVWHRITPRPLIERGTMRGRVPAALIVSFFVGTAIVAVVVEIPVLARITVTSSQTTAAFVLLRFLIAVPVGAFLGGWLLRRVGPALVAAPGLALAGVAVLFMSTWHSDALSGVVASTIVLLCAGCGVGLAAAPVNDAALADAPVQAHGLTSALVVVGRMMGMVVGLALLTAIGLHRFSTELAKYAHPDGKAVTAAGIVQVHTVFLGAGLGALLAAAIAFFFLGRQPIADSPDVAAVREETLRVS